MSEASVAEIEPPKSDVEAEPSVEPACTQCGRTEPWTETEWCPSCGYSQKYDRVFDLGNLDGEWNAPETPFEEAFPPWLQILGGGVVAILLLGVTARVTLPAPTRAIWTLAQILLGLIALAVGHVSAYLYAASESDKYGPFDVFFKPFGIWRPTTRDLPDNAWRCWCAAWGTNAVVVAVAVIGGVNWMGIFEEDWGFKKGAQKNLVHEVVKQARRERDGADSMEEALDEFAGEDEEAMKKVVPRVPVDALVIGYTKGANDEPATLLLASVFRKKLVYGTALPFNSLPEEDRAEFARVLPKIERPTPFIDVKMGGTWVEPVKLIRVRVQKRTSRGRLIDPVFDEVLEDVQ